MRLSSYECSDAEEIYLIYLLRRRTDGKVARLHSGLGPSHVLEATR